MTDNLDIPDFLRRRPGDTKPVAQQAPKPVQYDDPVERRQRELREAQQRRAEANRMASLSRHLQKHALERWDRKTKTWVLDPAKVAAEREREFAEHDKRL